MEGKGRQNPTLYRTLLDPTLLIPKITYSLKMKGERGNSMKRNMSNKEQ